MSSMVVLYPSSDSSSSSEESYNEEEDEQSMHDILKEFFTNEKNENIATILTNLTNEIKSLHNKLDVK